MPCQDYNESLAKRVVMNLATNIFARLTEIEKINLRRASSGTVEYLADTHYRVDMPEIPFSERVAVLTEVQAAAQLAFAVQSAETEFGKTWLF